MSMSTQRRHGSFKNLSSRLGFRHGNRQRANSSSAATATAVPRAFHKSLGNASLVEPRTSAATSAESELSETSTSTVGSPPRERPLNARSYSVADTQGLRDERALAAAAAEGTGGQIRVVFGKDEEFSSTGGKALGLTVSPAKDVGSGVSGQGAVIESLSERMGGAPPTPAGDNAARPMLLRPGDLVAEIDGQDVRRLPFSEVLRLLNASTPHVIKTTSAAGNAATGSGSTGGSSHPHPPHPGNSAKKMRRLLSAASVGPRTPGSNTRTAPPSASRSVSLAHPAPSTPRSPETSFSPVARPSSPRRYTAATISNREMLPPPLTDVRRVSWRPRLSSGKKRKDKDKAQGRGQGEQPVSASGNFFSASPSPAATPTNGFSSSSFMRAPSLNPWGGGTPGGKPGRLTRTRSMFSSTLGRLSPRVTVSSIMSPRPRMFVAGNSNLHFSATSSSSPRLASPAPPSTPSRTAATPPSPTGSSPLEKGSSVSASDGTPGSAAQNAAVRCLSSPSPNCTTLGREELLGLGAAAAAVRQGGRGSNLRFSYDLERGDCGLGDGDVEEDDEEKGEERKTKRQSSRASRMSSSSSAFFPTDTEDGDEHQHGARAGAKHERSCSQEEQDDEDEQKATEEQLRHRSSPQRAVDNEGGVGKGARGGEQEQEQDQAPEMQPLDQREEEEEEIVALARYLACAGRGWPWTGKNVKWAEYVSLNGHHRWIRSEQCRHALLLVQGALYLLELPKEAVTRHQMKGAPIHAPGGWYVRLNASDLSHLSVPLAPAKPGQDRFESGSGLILHKRGGVGACFWIECRSAASRDALVDLVSAWVGAVAETKRKVDGNGNGKVNGKGEGEMGKGTPKPLKVELRSMAQLSAVFGGADHRGRKFHSLINTDERQACALW